MATTIPKTQRAAVIVKLGGLVEVQNDWPVVQPEDLAPGQILVKMEASGVCHSDLHIKSGEWPTRPTPFVSGHEGIGTIVAFSKGTAETDDVKVGSRVGVKWVLTSCGRCEYCRTGRDPVCDNVLYGGQLVNGAFSEYMVAWANQVVPIPEGIPSDECVSILCAGYTVYGGLKNGNFKAGQWVVIPGAGGGLGHLAIQYAVAMGIRVIAIDTGDEKKKACLSLGAEKWIDFAESKDVVQDVIAAAGGPGPHGALIATPSITAYDQAIEYLRKYGTLVAIGVPTPPLKLNVTWGTVVWKALRIQGVVVGNLQDAVEALDFVARGKVHAHTQSRKLDEINQIYEEMSANKLIGRAVIHYDH